MNDRNLAVRSLSTGERCEDGGLDISRVLEDLTLLLIYLSSWREKVINDVWVTRSWKGYDFNVLDRLVEKGHISSTRGAKSVILTDDGIKEAERLKGILLRAVSKTYGKEGEKHHDFTSHRC